MITLEMAGQLWRPVGGITGNEVATGGLVGWLEFGRLGFVLF